MTDQSPSREKTMTKIAIASDHAGFVFKETLKAHLQLAGYEVRDFGTDSESAVDYPDYIRPAALSVARKDCDVGIVLGGSGNGEAMAANKIRGVRCAVCWNEMSARLAKEHNDANMISIGARLVNQKQAIIIIDTWLNAKFTYGRHVNRIAKLE
jgi:ribose 5-phosphate isomerase B